MMDAGPAWEALRERLRLPEPLPDEEIMVEQTAGRIAAEPVWAKSSSPSYMAAAMDGFAVHADETRAASEANPVELHDVQPIDTGDPIPAGYDAVVKIEDVHAKGGGIEITAA